MEKMKRRRLSAKERKQVYDKCNGHCAYCGGEIPFRGFQVDHIKPLYLGGTDTMDNMLPACRKCNYNKDTFDPEGYRNFLQGLYDRMYRNHSYFQALDRFGIIERKKDKVVFYFEEEKP